MVAVDKTYSGDLPATTYCGAGSNDSVPDLVDSLSGGPGDDVLDGGVNDSLNLDMHGKALSFHLLTLPILRRSEATTFKSTSAETP